MEDDKIMIMKSDKNKDKLTVKVRKKVRNQFVPNEYFKVVNLKDYNDLALFFEDLVVILNAPVERAFRKFKEKKEGGFPF